MSKDLLNNDSRVEFNSIGEYVSSLKSGGQKSLPAVNIYDRMAELFPAEMSGVENPLEQLKDRIVEEYQIQDSIINERKRQQEQYGGGKQQMPSCDPASHEDKEPPKKKKRSWWQRLIGYRNEPKESCSTMEIEGTHESSKRAKHTKRYGQWYSRNYKKESVENNEYGYHPLTKESMSERVESEEEVKLWGLYSLEKRKYSGGGIDQETGTIKLLWGLLQYENDWHPNGLTDKHGLGDGGDRYRTAKLTFGIKGLLRTGFKLGTGDPGMVPKNEMETIYRNIVYKGKQSYYAKGEKGMKNEHADPDKYRMGQAFIEIGNARIGINSEIVRVLIQNGLHALIGDDFFKMKDRKCELLLEKRNY